VAQRQLDQAVAVGDDERLARQQRLGPLDATPRGGALRRPPGGHPGPAAPPVADPVLDQLAQVMEIDHDLLDAAGTEELEDVRQHRATRDRHERLRETGGGRRQARPAAPRQDHGATDHEAPAASSGTHRVTWRRTAASSGNPSKACRATAYTAGK